MNFKVVIHTAYDFDEYYNVFENVREYLIQNGIGCDIVPMIKDFSPDATIKNSLGYNAALVSHEIWDESVFKALSKDLVIISKLGIGVDSIDLDAARRYGVAVTNTPGANASAVADMAVTMMMALNRKINVLDAKMKSGEWWNSYLGGQLEGATVGLVGFGTIAQIVARYLGGFGCRIIAYDPYFNKEVGAKYNVQEVGLDKLAMEADFVSVHIPLLKETKELINRAFFARMKRTTFFVNTSRGQVINEKDLIFALKERLVAGAALDVFESEPLHNSSPLRNMENVILTAHLAGNTTSAVQRVGKIAADNMISVFQGKVPRFIVNPGFENNSKVKFN